MKLTRILPALALALLVASLAGDPAAAATHRRKSHKKAAAPAPPAPTSRPMVLPFIHDDYTRAVAEAKARRVPIFIESWAPW